MNTMSIVINKDHFQKVNCVLLHRKKDPFSVIFKYSLLKYHISIQWILYNKRHVIESSTIQKTDIKGKFHRLMAALSINKILMGMVTLY